MSQLTLFIMRVFCSQVFLTLTGAAARGAEPQGREVRDTGTSAELDDVGHTWESGSGPDGDRGRMKRSYGGDGQRLEGSGVDGEKTVNKSGNFLGE